MAAALASLTCSRPCAAPSAPSTSYSSRRLSSSAHFSGHALLQASSRRAAHNARDRSAALAVAAFQIPSSKWWKIKSPPNMVHINSVQQLVDEMAGAGDRLVMFDIFSPGCAACRALYPKLCKLLEQHPEVLTLAINFDENKMLVKALGVKVLPFFIFYRGKDGKLDQFAASSKRLPLLEEAILKHTSPRCYLPSIDEDEPVLAEFPKVQPSTGAPSVGDVAEQAGRVAQPVA